MAAAAAAVIHQNLCSKEQEAGSRRQAAMRDTSRLSPGAASMLFLFVAAI